MITFSIIQKSQLEGAMRMDAEYYNPAVFIDFSKGNWYKVSEVLDFVQYGTSEDLNEERLGFPTLRLNEFDDVFIEKPSKYCNKVSEKIARELELKKGDVLICRTNGNPKLVGKSAIVMNDNNYIFASYLFRVRTKKNILSSTILMTYLNSKVGRAEIERFSLTSNQTNFSPATLKEIRIPAFSKEFQEKNEQLVVDAHDLHEQSKSLYQQAEELLLKELDLKDFEFDKICSSIVNFSDILEIGRMDAEFFQPKYEKIISKIKSQNHKRLGDLVSMKKGIEVGAEQYQEEGKVFIRVSSLGKFEINESEQKCLSDKLYEKLKADFEPRKGEILLTKDASPGIAHVVKTDIEGIISGGILRLKLKNSEVDNEYLALCLNSIVGKMQAERDAGGSVIAHWKPEQIRNVVIPILPKTIQQKITDLVLQSHEARKKAKELLEEAKRKVEEMIENK
jgi:restriction endonuclease S subunit